MKGSWTRPEESVDELASNTLPVGRSSGREPSIRTEPGVRTRGSSMSTTPAELTHFQSSYTLSEGVGMPVPPPPHALRFSSTDQHRSLPTRNAKPKLGRKGDKKRVRPVISNPTLLGPDPQMSTRPIISNPTLLGPGPQMITRPIISNPTLLGPAPQMNTRPIISSPMAQEASSFQTGMLHDDGEARPKDIATTHFTAADAEAITRKIQMLNNQQGVEKANVEKPLRLSPLQRGKAVLARATRAIGVRMNSNQTNGTSKQAVPNVEEGTPPSSSSFNGVTPESNTNEGSPTRIDLRIAEGVNLGRKKVQAVMGDGYIKRKPVPGTEKKRAPTPVPEEDPDADRKMAMMMAIGTPGFSGFDFDFPPSGAQRNSAHLSSQRNSRVSRNSFAGGSQSEFDARFAPTNSRSSLEEPAEREAFSSSSVEPSTPLVGSSGSTGFSDSISGLAQHPDVMTFATAPTDVSTPRVRSERAHIPNNQKRSRAVLMRDNSIFNVGFGNGGEDYAPFDAPRSGPSPLRTSSIKRKSALFELPSNRSTLKKTKRDSIMSEDLTEEEAALITGIGQLHTEDRQALLPKDENMDIKPRDNDGFYPIGTPNRGLAMSDTSKGKEPMTSEGRHLQPMAQRRAPPLPERHVPQMPQRPAPQLPGHHVPPMPQRPAPQLPGCQVPQMSQRPLPQLPRRHLSQLPQHPPPQLPQRRAVAHPHSAIPRPATKFHGNGMRARGAYDTEVDNPMDVDELQTSDRAYEVGRKS